MERTPPARERSRRGSWTFLVPVLVSIAAVVFAAAGMWETTFIRQELSLPQYAVTLPGYGAIRFAVASLAARPTTRAPSNRRH